MKAFRKHHLTMANDNKSLRTHPHGLCGPLCGRSYLLDHRRRLQQMARNVRIPILRAVVRRHTNQMRKILPHPTSLEPEEPPAPTEHQRSSRRVRFADEQMDQPAARIDVDPPAPELRRSNRQRRPPTVLEMDASKPRYDQTTKNPKM
uniref:Uncharacterized protein n=1 Tax=Globodera rostochiensis TaxID=31243 RepID=A0A914HBK9_GLORO